MMNIPKKIGMAPFFNSDFSLEKRLSSETEFSILKQPAQWSDDICLFRLPEHLRKRWWDIAAKELLSAAVNHPEFNLFLNSFKAFAHYKGIPILSENKFKVLVRPPGESCEFTDDLGRANISSLVNLGDEQTHIIIGKEQVLLESGDGCWVPLGCTIKLADTLAKTDLDVLLQIISIA